MVENYNVIFEHYEKCFDKYGDSHRGVDWPNEEDTYKRYQIMLNVIFNSNDGTRNSILDFGCGCGHLLSYILKNNLPINYIGMDISKKFIGVCKDKFPTHIFYHKDILIDSIEEVPSVDYVVMNGVFTEKRNLTDEQMWDFFTKVLIKIFSKAKIGIAFNVMCPIVDYKDEKLFYLSYDKLGLFLKNNLSRHYVINNHYKLWEYTVYVYRDEIH